MRAAGILPVSSAYFTAFWLVFIILFYRQLRDFGK
jgi:hypothetical protein